VIEEYFAALFYGYSGVIEDGPEIFIYILIIFLFLLNGYIDLRCSGFIQLFFQILGELFPLSGIEDVLLVVIQKDPKVRVCIRLQDKRGNGEITLFVLRVA
jgi:hypothetical protein